MMLPTAPVPPAAVEGGPGWVLDGASLLPRITDLAAFREGMNTDPLADAVEALWSGDPVRARELLHTADPTVRVCALLADCSRDLGDVDDALQTYADLMAECTDTPWEPVLRQHHGKSLLAAGRIEEALAEFETAHAMRVAAGAPADLVASSAQACERARQLVTAGHLETER
ncbi:hypothetical protein FNH13_03275 [Ornithinimicrobium ciconiae]|uniref:Tetratricopeptide repeat protein n=1 Tax=Ornithinimicrobium ciconiae TaxID=2594265 RepID=A0A516G7H1_9MICO|nr:hypothetical protein [Ornithinimicrobium ciconiae]QDO87476.1 hypothetical protein FNH13_03275 [Ornithinimicrobium ciconiae]